jgi:hypothetical protein
VREPWREREKNENSNDSTLSKSKTHTTIGGMAILFNNFGVLGLTGFGDGGGSLCFCVL